MRTLLLLLLTCQPAAAEFNCTTRGDLDAWAQLSDMIVLDDFRGNDAAVFLTGLNSLQLTQMFGDRVVTMTPISPSAVGVVVVMVRGCATIRLPATQAMMVILASATLDEQRE